MQDWIVEELRTVDLGDGRLDKRLAILLEQLSGQPSESIPTACAERKATVAAYRFFDNDKVEAATVLHPHHDATVERCRREQTVLAVQDTTEVDMTRKHERVGGPLNTEDRWGLFVHPVIAFTPEGVPLGVLAEEMWSRDPKEFAQSTAAKKKKRRQQPIEAKESYRWLQGYETAQSLAEACPETRVVSVADSEADIYEIFVAGTPTTDAHADFLVRACHDRNLDDRVDSLRQTVLCTKRLARMTVDVSQRDAPANRPKRKQARAARQAKVSIRATRVLLHPPPRKGIKLPPVYVNAILVLEEKPPAGEEPIEWLLLTSLPIATADEVHAVIGFYCVRWQIEIYFRVLKSGCQIEKLQLETEERLKPCLALYLIVAWRVMQLTMLSRAQPEMRCDLVFEEAEWKAVWTIVKRQPPPTKPPSLAEMVELVAQLGGYQGRKHDGPPGPKSIWIGLRRMRDFAAAYECFGPGAPQRKKCV